MNSKVLFLTILLASQAFADGGGSSIGPSHPAGKYCLKKKGVLVSYTTAPGESELCTFGRGQVDKMTLWYHASANVSERAIEVYLEHPTVNLLNLGNPASEYCEAMGGESRPAVMKETNDQFGMCWFSDNSSIEEWTLFRGPQDPLNKKLTKLLKK